MKSTVHVSMVAVTKKLFKLEKNMKNQNLYVHLKKNSNFHNSAGSLVNKKHKCEMKS